VTYITASLPLMYLTARLQLTHSIFSCHLPVSHSRLLIKIAKMMTTMMMLSHPLMIKVVEMMMSVEEVVTSTLWVRLMPIHCKLALRCHYLLPVLAGFPLKAKVKLQVNLMKFLCHRGWHGPVMRIRQLHLTRWQWLILEVQQIVVHSQHLEARLKLRLQGRLLMLMHQTFGIIVWCHRVLHLHQFLL